MRGSRDLSDADSDDNDVCANHNLSPEAFMEELCASAGGYNKFFRSLLIQYVGFHVAVFSIPAIFLDHHRCEGNQSAFAWILYVVIILLCTSFAVLVELNLVQAIGLLDPRDVPEFVLEERWRLPLILSFAWKLDLYTDVAFVFVAFDCGSSLWWASVATTCFTVVFCQLLLNGIFACNDCDRELPASFGFVMLDFKLVNAAVKHVMPFDPDKTHLSMSRAITLPSSGNLIALQKIVGDVAQVSIQALFVGSQQDVHLFVYLSMASGTCHGIVAVVSLVKEFVRQGNCYQSGCLEQGVALQPKAPHPTPQLGHEPYGSCSLSCPPSIVGRQHDWGRFANRSSAPLPGPVELDLL